MRQMQNADVRDLCHLPVARCPINGCGMLALSHISATQRTAIVKQYAADQLSVEETEWWGLQQQERQATNAPW